jgi:hypothetical protein
MTGRWPVPGGHARGNGKTTRMLAYVAQRVRDDPEAAFCIMAADKNHAEHLRHSLAHFGLADDFRVQVKTAEEVSNYIDLRTLDVRILLLGHRIVGVEIVWDHHTLERLYAKPLAELHRWDLP